MKRSAFESAFCVFWHVSTILFSASFPVYILDVSNDEAHASDFSWCLLSSTIAVIAMRYFFHVIPQRRKEERVAEYRMKAKYEIVEEYTDKMIIRDVGGKGDKSVTNDAEAVVADLHVKGLGNRRLFYYDSMDRLDELVHDGCGNFVEFKPVI